MSTFATKGSGSKKQTQLPVNVKPTPVVSPPKNVTAKVSETVVSDSPLPVPEVLELPTSAAPQLLLPAHSDPVLEVRIPLQDASESVTVQPVPLQLQPDSVVEVQPAPLQLQPDSVVEVQPAPLQLQPESVVDENPKSRHFRLLHNKHTIGLHAIRRSHDYLGKNTRVVTQE